MYLVWKEETLTSHDDKTINERYNDGFVFTRVGKGVMNQTRSVRIDLAQFTLSSENRRILKKTEDVLLEKHALPYSDYHWSIGKLGKDFYTEKFGDGTFSANKIKELLTSTESNFNTLLIYKTPEPTGYAICAETNEIIHYSYPFYDLEKGPKNMGMGMMLKAILYAQKSGKKYIYLGSAQRPTDVYKLQFAGLEWFDGEKWNTDPNGLKEILTTL